MGTLTCTPWCTASDLTEAATTAGGLLPVGRVDAAIDVASDLLFALSGRRWTGAGCTRAGVEVDLWPDVRPSAGDRARKDLAVGCGPRPDALSRILLPDYPVTDVTAVVQDGVALAAGNWRMVNGRWLERVDPATSLATVWSARTLTVDYTFGAATPDGGRYAAASYASQLLLSWSSSQGCRLPQRVQSISRQGVTLAVLDPFDFLDKGRTGLVEVDAWLATVNPAKAKRRASVWSPDVDNRTSVRF